MPMAIELFFDQDSDATIRRIWADLAAAGLPSTMLESRASRPHISILASRNSDTAAVAATLADLAAVTQPFEAQLDAVGFFNSPEGVAFLSVTPNQMLLKLHQECFERCGHAMGALWEHYLPGKLAYHCTLTQGLKPDQASRVLELACRQKFPVRVKILKIGLMSFPPIEERCAYPLFGSTAGSGFSQPGPADAEEKMFGRFDEDH